MRCHRAGLVLAVFASLTACSNPAGEETALLGGSGVTAIVTDQGEGVFEVHYSFAEPQSVMIFPRSETAYRAESWLALDDGAQIERLNGLDALVFDAPVREARFQITARPELRYDGYAHFVRFADGSLVLFTGQFELMPAASREAVLALDGDLSAFDGEQPVLGVKLRSDQPMIAHGERFSGDVTDISQGGGSFVYIGEGEIETRENFVGLIDPATPDWLQTRFRDDLDMLFSELEAGWGYGMPEPATLLFAFEGTDNPGFSSKGGALGRQLMIQASGQDLAEDNDFLHAYLLWFFAHESVHLFQYVTGPTVGDQQDSWIHEGSANAMANRIMAGQGEAAATYLRWARRNAFNTCSASLEAGPLAEAWQRGEGDAYYACGEFIGVMTDAALPEETLFDFWNAMLARAGDGDISDETYFATARALGMPEAQVSRLEALVRDTLANPREELRNALADFGLDPQFDADDNLSGLTYPDP